MKLARAIICINCDELLDGAERIPEFCPRCASTMTIPLARWINRPSEPIARVGA